MATPVQVRRKVLGDLYEQHLRAGLVGGPGATAAAVYRGETPSPGKMPELPDSAGRIAPYVVLFDGVGIPDIEPDLAGENRDLRWTVHLILGAGWEADCSALVDRVCELSYRWSPAIPGTAAGRMEPPPGYDPGPLRRNDTVSPPRWWTPLQWRLDVTAS